MPETRNLRSHLLLFVAAWAIACGDDAQVESRQSPIYVCGNGELEPGEECDDGNLADGDSCSSRCKVAKIDVHVTTNACPTVEGFVISPSQIPAGFVATARVVASDANDDPLTYEWSAPSGTFTTPDQAETGYTCDAEGSQLIHIAVADDRHCTEERNIPVVCLR